MNGLLGRRRLLELFDELSKELRFQGARAQIYIVGGAAMSLAYSRARRTEDVDARIDAGHSRLTEAVRTVGRRHGLGDSWLKEQATTAIPRASDGRATTLYESPYLTVTGVGQAPVGDEAAGGTGEGPGGHWGAVLAPGTEGSGGRDPDLPGVVPGSTCEAGRAGRCGRGVSEPERYDYGGTSSRSQRRLTSARERDCRLRRSGGCAG